MALSSRDLWIILRARDEASRVFRAFGGTMDEMDRKAQQQAARQTARGQAMVTIGAAMVTGGIMALSVLNDMTNAASDYTQQATLAMTQTDGVVTSVGELKKIGLDVARTIPVAFDQIQTTMYDIFSSMDVSVSQAKMLLTAFSKAAVAGQVDLQTAARGTIAILNAYHLPAESVNRVNDIMFQLVRKGVGTYEEFAKSIGRAIPAAVRAGQSFETLAGMMAFLTRNGLSTTMAATSSARALEAMANPRTVKRIEDMGIKMKGTNGEFLPMVDILGDMNKQLGSMTSPERAAALQNLFKGSGGTIQARRFFDVVFKNFDEFEKRVQDMQHSAGALDRAYELMFNTPQAKMTLMTNKYQAMSTEIGDKLIPIKLKLVEAISKVLDGWSNLSPVMQNVIAYGALIASGLLIVGGAILIAAGASLILTARYGELSVSALLASARLLATGAAAGESAGMMATLGTVASVTGTKIRAALMTPLGMTVGVAGVVLGIVFGLRALDGALNEHVVVPAKAAQDALRKFANGGKADINVFFNNWEGSISKQTRDTLSGVKDMNSALDTLFNRDTKRVWEDMLGGPFFDSGADKVKAKFGEIDQALADMISGGNVKDAEAAFKQIADAAEAQIIPMSTLITVFPKYKDAMLGVDQEQSTLNNLSERYSGILNDNTMSLADAQKALQAWIDKASDAAGSFIDLQDAYDTLMENNKALAQSVADSTKSADDSWTDYIDRFQFHLDDYITSLEAQVKAQQDWETNMILLTGRVSQGVIDELIKMGPKAAPIVAAMVNATGDELTRMEAVFAAKSTDATQAWANVMADSQTVAVMTEAASKLGIATATEIAVQLNNGTATVADIMAKYGLIVEGVVPTFHANDSEIKRLIAESERQLQVLGAMTPTPEINANMDRLRATVDAARAYLATLKNKDIVITAEMRQTTSYYTNRAIGGPIYGPGTSTSDSIPAMLSNGEFVMRAAAVQKYGIGKMWALNSLQYAHGGVAGNPAPVDFGQSKTGGAYGSVQQVTFDKGSIQVFTQEIDPLLHSKQIAFEIARSL